MMKTRLMVRDDREKMRNILEARHPKYNFSNARDVEYIVTDKIMVLPIPNNEISSNLKLSPADQNPGY